jgi:hypothetical protein
LQALQLAYSQLERRQQELDATNAFLRREMTEKIERKCNALDEEVVSHQKFVFIRKKNYSILILLSRKMDEDVKRKLDEAKNDVAAPSLSSFA